MATNQAEQGREWKGHLNGIVGADEVLIDGLEPADVVVRVRDEVHVDLAIDRGTRGVVLLVRRREQGRPCSGGQEHTVR